MVTFHTEMLDFSRVSRFLSTKYFAKEEEFLVPISNSPPLRLSRMQGTYPQYRSAAWHHHNKINEDIDWREW